MSKPPVKLKAVKRRKSKKKKPEPEPKPRTAVMLVKLPYSEAIHKLISMTGNPDEIEKELSGKAPRNWMYFFHLHDFINILKRVKSSNLSMEDFNRWLNLLKPRFGKEIFIAKPDGRITYDSLKCLYRLQKENKLTKEATIALLKGIPIKIKELLYVPFYPEMEVVGKKKKMAKVKSIIKKK